MGRRRRKRVSGLNLLLAINKPAGLVTRSVDNHIGCVLRDDCVGHIGTLDPAVTGVLVIAIGQARKLISRIEDDKRKAYAAHIVFGTQTDTDDAEGTVIREAPIPKELAEFAYAREVLSSFVGRSMQRPPNYSAIKVDGVRAYDRARAGEVFELPKREIEVFDARLCGIDTTDGVAWDCEFVVSAGTYIRALARDMGTATQSAAHLGRLCRTASGLVSLDDCITLEQLDELGPERAHEAALDPCAVLGYPQYRLSDRELERARNGVALATKLEGDASPYSLVHGDKLYGVWSLQDGMLRPLTNCPQGIEGVRQ